MRVLNVRLVISGLRFEKPIGAEKQGKKTTIINWIFGSLIITYYHSMPCPENYERQYNGMD